MSKARRRGPWFERLVSGVVVGAVVGLLVAAAALVRPDWLERGEFWTYDQRARSAARAAEASRDVVVLTIGEHDIEDVENVYGLSWPWPRELFGYLAQFSHRAGARAVVFDWLFQDRAYGVTDAETFADAMRAAGNAVIGLALTSAEQVRRPLEGPWAAPLPAPVATRAEGQAIALRLAAWNTRSFLVPAGADPAGPFSLWYGGKRSADDVRMAHQRLSGVDDLRAYFVDPAAPVDPDTGDAPVAEPAPAELPRAALAGEVTIHDVIAERDGLALDPGELALPVRDGLDPPLAPIAAGAARGGSVYQDPEADGVMRQHTPLVRHGDRLYPSLALAAYLVAHPGVQPRFDGRTLVLGERRVPLDARGRVGVRFHGRGVYARVGAFEVMRSLALLEEREAALRDELVAAGVAEDEAGRRARQRAAAEAALPVPLQALAGKYVIVAASAQALRDIRVTPVSTHMEGAEVQATALDNLEHGRFVVRTGAVLDAALALVLCLVTAVGMVLLWGAIPRASLALAATLGSTAALLAGYWALAGWLYGAHDTWLAVAGPASGISLSAFSALLVTSAAERRGRRFVQEALGRYTSQELVRELVAHPEYLSLEWGERRAMSVYFSDIAGFTTISEGLPPERLVALLNDYLTHMTDIVLQHGGVVDKYIGDAVMAFWGAPIPDPEHARRAVRCALAMRRKCDELRPVWLRDYGTEVRARAGVNSGFAVVGNMGSKHKYNYTAMGDMVNLASRLEGANKPYGTYLMISEFTLAEVADLVEVRELDLLAVKGKDQPVRVFEVLDEKGRTDAATQAAVARYLDGLARYRARDFVGAITAFEAALTEKPADPPSMMYIERCRHFADRPPPQDWDGVWRLEEK